MRDIVTDHEQQLDRDMRVGTLKAMGYSASAIQRQLGLTAAEVSASTVRLERCADRLAA